MSVVTAPANLQVFGLKTKQLNFKRMIKLSDLITRGIASLISKSINYLLSKYRFMCSASYSNAVSKIMTCFILSAFLLKFVFMGLSQFM